MAFGRIMNADKAKCIMVVEDEVDLGLLLTHNLEKLNYRTVNVTDGRDALNKIFEIRPDLILLDVLLPNLNGFEICRYVKLVPETRNIPIIIYSSLDKEMMAKGKDLGAVDCFSKSGSLSDVISRVQVLLN